MRSGFKKLSPKRFGFYVLGIFISTFGISMTILSKLGTSPFDALLVGLSIQVGLSVGSWEIIIGIIMIGCNALLMRCRPEVLGLITAFIMGFGIDFWLFVLSAIVLPELWYSKLVCFGIGLVTIGFGTAMYLQTNIAPIPVDRLTLIIKELTRTSIFFARTLIYLLFLILAFIFSGPIGVGTILTLCFGGLVLNFFMPLTGKIIKQYVSQSDPAPDYDQQV